MTKAKISFRHSVCAISPHQLRQWSKFAGVLAGCIIIKMEANKWTMIADLTNVSENNHTCKLICDLLMGSQLEWKEPSLQLVEAAMQQLNISLQSPDPRNPQEDERTNDVDRWDAKKKNDKALKELGLLTSLCYLQQGFQGFLGEAAYNNLEGALLLHGNCNVCTEKRRCKLTN